MKTRMWILSVVFVAVACGAVSASEGEAGAAQPGIFSGSIGDSLWTVVAFVILVTVLGKLAWKPLINGLKDREDSIRLEITSAENARKQAEKTLADYNSRVEQLEQKARQMTEDAGREAHRLGHEIAEKARQESLAIKQKAQSDIDAAHAAAKEKLWEETGDIVLALSSRVLG
ncbi:MAG: F0F1 ATP synthase subunit B, partial [Sedimentisphaerales bacterium]|nr:F0F1 ATP synthase subunit B [Sedimentisphaerales bacterium]